MHGPREPRRTARASPLAGWKTAWSRAANMRCVSGPKLWLVAMALAGGSLPCAGEPREADLSAGPPTAVARSALAILEAAAAPAGVTLRLRRAADQTPLPATGVTVSVAGRNAPATASADGSWFAPLPAAVGAGDTLEVVVAHDGIRELLSARFAAPGARDAGGGAAAADASGAARSRASPSGAAKAAGVASLWRDHKQMAWWILNITVVLIATIALSRRMS